MSHPLNPAEEYFAKLVKELGSLPGVTLRGKKGFGSSGLTIHDKTFAMLLKNGKLAVKLPQARVNALIESRVGERFEFGQKSMKEWLTLEPSSQEHWLPTSLEAMEFVASQL